MRRFLTIISMQLSASLIAGLAVGLAQELDPVRQSECNAEASKFDCSQCAADCEQCQSKPQNASVLSEDAFSKILKYSAMLLKGDMNQPLKFEVQTPDLAELESKFAITLCGHVCDGNVCYEVADNQTPSPSDVQVDSITVQEGAPPMPILTLSRAAKTVAPNTLATAEVKLDAPVAAELKSLAEENAELKTKLAVIEKELELRKEYEDEVKDLMSANTELAVQVAELSATRDSMDAMLSLMIEKNDVAAELRAAKEWIGQHVASDTAASEESKTVAALVGMIEDLRSEVRAITSSDSASTSKKANMPVPFARSSYVPVYAQLQSNVDQANTTCTEDCPACLQAEKPECTPVK